MSSRHTTAVQPGTLRQALPSRVRGSLLGWCAAAGIIAAIAVMAGAGLLRGNWQPPILTLPASGPPWQLSAHLPAWVIVVALWAAALLGGGGVLAGLVAVCRGLPVPVRTLLVAAAVGVAVLVVLPPVGSTDALDYAVYGHIAALGHSPYVMTPVQYRRLMHLRFSVPLDWEHDPSYYGPLATAEQLAAAKLAGASLARTVFWLKLWNAVAFAAVGLAADRLWRADRAARTRALLLWTANPLLAWSLIAAGHLDVVAAAVGVAALLVAGLRAVRPAPTGWWWAVAAGACAGAAADIKVDYVLFVLAACWALRRFPGRAAVAAAAAGAVLVGSYAIVGMAAVRALAGRASAGLGWEYYGFIFRHLGISLNAAVPVAACLMLPLAVLALARIPAGPGDQPGGQAIRAGLALSLAWLLLWPHQYAWYSVMIMSVLVCYPASRLDWIAMAWLSAITFADIPGLGHASHRLMNDALDQIQYQNLDHLAPLVLLGALVTFVTLCINLRWRQQSALSRFSDCQS